jgi:hypothetical protein
MTIYEPNPEVGPTGEEVGEYVDDLPDQAEDDETGELDPERRPTGTPPLAG